MSPTKKARKYTDEPEPVRVSLRMPVAVVQAVDAWGAERDVKRSDAIRQLLESALKMQRVRPVRAGVRTVLAPDQVRELAGIVGPYVAAINKLGNNVNQIARKANTGERSMLGRPVVTDKTLQAMTDEMVQLRAQGERIDQLIADMIRGQ